ncbi:MAG TPA: lamin tail domain-containing protein [Vicinamibacterales bacterium]|nr:lamin tail domain-containing protein [Vicinamibacterales bacterium]
MSDLTVMKGFPNPPSKDRTAHRLTNEQLNNEWMEFANTSGRELSLNGVKLLDYTFNHACQKTSEKTVIEFVNNLAAGHSVRVHTGTGTAYTEGTVRHVFAGHGNFVWNNACGDTAILRNGHGTLIDWASYEPNPPEVVLYRVPNTNRLSPVAATRTA